MFLMNCFKLRDDNIKIIYYYQTFSSLDKLINSNIKNAIVYISSIHFGKNTDGTYYIHLNDETPYEQDKLWNNIQKAKQNNIRIMVMLGGAGGAYTTLFENYKVCYKLLYNFLKYYDFIEGIDLDIEEGVELNNVKTLIECLDKDFGENYIITMAPIAYSLTNDYPGMGGFIYKELYKSVQGQRINWFNVQCYGCLNFNTYDLIIKNGYPINKIVIGMLGDDIININPVLDTLKEILDKYNSIHGVVLWEYGDTKIDPIEWGENIQQIKN